MKYATVLKPITFHQLNRIQLASIITALLFACVRPPDARRMLANHEWWLEEASRTLYNLRNSLEFWLVNAPGAPVLRASSLSEYPDAAQAPQAPPWRRRRGRNYCYCSVCRDGGHHHRATGWAAAPQPGSGQALLLVRSLLLGFFFY